MVVFNRKYSQQIIFDTVELKSDRGAMHDGKCLTNTDSLGKLICLIHVINLYLDIGQFIIDCQV